MLALPHLLERRRAALASFARRLPDLPAMLVAARERVRDRGGRLVLALPGLVAVRPPRAWTGRATTAVRAAAGGGRRASARRTSAGPADPTVCRGGRCARRGRVWTAPPRGWSRCRRWRCWPGVMRW